MTTSLAAPNDYCYTVLACPYSIMNDITTSSKVSCTPAFQPPEALTWGFTENPITSDVWALGVCLYCFVFGRLPFTGTCVLDITNSITNDTVRAEHGALRCFVL